MVSALDYFNKALDWYKSSDDFEMFIPEIIELYCQLTYIYNKLNNREESQNAIDIAKTILDTYYKKDSYIYLKHLYILYRAVKTDEKSCELCLNYACKILSIYNTLDNAHKKTLPFSNLQVETDIFNFHHQLQDEEYISGNALDVFFKAIYCFDINETSLEIDKAYYLLSASTCITELINIGKTNEALLIYENGNRYVNSMNDSDKQLHEFEILNYPFLFQAYLVSFRTEDPLMLPEYRQRTEYHTPEAILESDFSFPQSLVLVCKLVFFCLP